jgi:hypothetical protein
MNENLKSALEQVGIDLVKELTKQLLNADKKASGNLIKSLDYKVVETVDGFILNLLAADYLNTVDQGRKPGKMPPPSKLDKWIVVRGIAPRDKKGKFISRKSIQFLIARSIGKNGIKPTNVIRKSIDSIYSNKIKLLEQAAVKDIVELIEKIKI